MSFDLNIMFAGMCLLVEDPADTKLYALMPPAAPGGGTGKHDHLARLYYREGHRTAGSTPAGAPIRKHELEHRLLDLTSVKGTSTEMPTLPSELFNMDGLMNRRVSRDLLTGDGSKRVISRVVVPSGVVTDTNPGANWRIGEEGPRPMATWVTWTIPDVAGESLEFYLHPLSGGGTSERIELHPMKIGTKASIDLYIFHTTRDDQPAHLPPVAKPADLRPGAEAVHFRHFYTLFDHPPVPVFESDAAAVTDVEAPKMGMRPICVSATATLE